jgi:hypothetical protein
MTTPADEILYDDLKNRFPEPDFRIRRAYGVITAQWYRSSRMHSDPSPRVIEALLRDEVAKAREAGCPSFRAVADTSV